jgi:hypothetical protein
MSNALTPNLLRTPDWTSIRLLNRPEAANALKSILVAYDPLEKQVFALRGMCALLIEERSLWEQFIDPEVDEPFQSFDRFLKWSCPNSWGYVRDALRAVKELKDLPFEDLLQIKRSNLEQLKRVSSSVRILPEVVQAAKAMPEKQFVDKMNKEHSQHLSAKTPVVMVDSEAHPKLEEAIEMATLLYGCKSRGEALEYIAADWVENHAVEFEHREEIA